MRILGTNLPEDAWFNPVAVATTGSNITLSGQQTIDGVVVGQYAAGDPRNVRALVKDQTNSVANGLYDTNSGTWTRCLDANDKTQWGQGVQVLVTGGTANGGIAYRCTTTPTNGQIIPGTSALTFAVSFFASANEMETLTLAMPAEFSVTGSPTSGNNPTITVAKANQNANLVYAGPSSGGAAVPAFRAVVAADLPASVPLAVTNDTNVTGSIAGQTLTLGWTGTLAAARLNANVVQGVTNDTNITATIAAQNITFAWASTLAVARGGTGGGTASGTLLDNITGFASTGFIERAGAGAYSFIADPLPPAHGGTGLATLTAHAVLLGEGTGNIGFATIGTGGRLLIDQGAAADPSFNAMSGDATITSGGTLTIAANAVTYAKLAVAAQGLSFVRNAQTANYTLLNSDKGDLIALGGSAFFTLTVNAASGYDSNFAVLIANEDSGRAKSLAINGLTTFMLWPGQRCLLINDNNTWLVAPSTQRWQTSAAVTFFVDVTNGNDSNDGLAAGTGNALATIQKAINTVISSIDSRQNAVNIQLADGTYTEHVSLAQPLIGTTEINLGGASGHGASVIWNVPFTGSAIGLYVKDFGIVGLHDMTLQGAAGVICVEAEQGGIIDIGSGITFGSVSTTGTHVYINEAGHVNFTASYSVTGNADKHILNQAGKLLFGSGITITGSSSLTINNFLYSYGTAINLAPSTITLSGFASITGQKFLIYGGATLLTNGVDPDTYFPGTNGVYGAGLANDGGNLAGGGFGAFQLVGYASGINFNSANTDNAIKINVPKGFTKLVNINVFIYGASGTLTTATAGLFTATGGGGTAICATQAVTVSTSADATNNNTGSMTVFAGNGVTTSIAVSAGTTWQYRIGTAEGAAATANVAIYARPLP